MSVMEKAKEATEIPRAEYERRLAAFVAEEKAKLAEKPVGFFGNWAFHAAKRREFDKRLKRAGVRVELEPSSTATPGTLRSASQRWNGRA